MSFRLRHCVGVWPGLRAAQGDLGTSEPLLLSARVLRLPRVFAALHEEDACRCVSRVGRRCAEAGKVA